MLTETGRLVGIWLRITLLLSAVLAIVWLIFGWGSAPLVAAAVTAAVIELWTLRGLVREWIWLARGSWWWG